MWTSASNHPIPLLPPLHGLLQHMFLRPLAPTPLPHHVSASGTLPSLSTPTGPGASAAIWPCLPPTVLPLLPRVDTIEPPPADLASGLNTLSLPTSPTSSHESSPPSPPVARTRKRAWSDFSAAALHMRQSKRSVVTMSNGAQLAVWQPHVTCNKRRRVVVRPFNHPTQGTNGETERKQCQHCGTHSTSLWRCGPLGKGTLCNAFVPRTESLSVSPFSNLTSHMHVHGQMWVAVPKEAKERRPEGTERHRAREFAPQPLPHQERLQPNGVGDQVLLGLPEGPPTHHLKKEKKTVRAFRRCCNYYYRVWSQPAHITRTGARVCGLVDSLLGTIRNLLSPTYTHTHTTQENHCAVKR